MRLGRARNDAIAPVTLPARGDVVTLICPSGEEIPARVSERGPRTLLIFAMFAADSPFAGQLEGIALEFPSPRGMVRLTGTVTEEDSDLLRFSDLYTTEVLQQREFVRINSNRPLLVYLGRDRLPVQSYTVDISGGGLLLAGPDSLEIGEDIEFQLTLASGGTPIEGMGTVVRSDVRRCRAISFSQISPGDHRRLVRFIFDSQRAERRHKLELNDRIRN